MAHRLWHVRHTDTPVGVTGHGRIQVASVGSQYMQVTVIEICRWHEWSEEMYTVVRLANV